MIDTCFNVECVLLSRNFDFLGGYLVVNARYLVVTTRYRSLLLVPTFSMNEAGVINKGVAFDTFRNWKRNCRHSAIVNYFPVILRQI